MKPETTRGSTEHERDRNDLLSPREPSTDLIATERKALEATIKRLGSEQHPLLALGHANAEREALLGTASWRLTSPLRNAYRLIRASERFIRRRVRPSGAAAPETRSAQSNHTVKARSHEAADDEQLIERSDLLDPEWYRSQIPGAIASSLARHYLTKGAATGLDPNPLFDTSWYLEQYPDLRNSGNNPLVHYLKYGAAEGRDPNPFFDSDWYLEQNPDVQKAEINPLRHYLHYGDAEGRDPSERFSIRWYREKYLEQEHRGINALDHYIRFGRAAGFEPKSPNGDYLLEILKQEQAFAASLPEIERHISAMVIKPRFFIVICGEDVVLRRETEDSLQAQVYLDYVVVEYTSAVPDNLAETETSPWFFICLESGDRMHISALYAFASAINADPKVDILYTDHDHLDDAGVRTHPFFKPDWSPDYLELMNYIGLSACFRWGLAQPFVERGSRGYDLILRLTELTRNILHIRQTLFHRRQDGNSCSSEDIKRDVEALKGRLHRTDRAGDIQPVIPHRRCYDCKINLSSKPLVSVIVPTAGKRANLGSRSIDLLANCLETIGSRSTYKNVEFIIVDNGDLSSPQRLFLRNYGAKSITFREFRFNVAKKLNLGASIASGELLLLLNDDVEPLASDWIERLVEHFEKPHVGVVGAKLLYEDRTTQHVGVVLNSCNPDHVRRLKPRDDLGYYFSTAAVRNFSAVTGACMMTSNLSLRKNWRILRIACGQLQRCGLLFESYGNWAHHSIRTKI